MQGPLKLLPRPLRCRHGRPCRRQGTAAVMNVGDEDVVSGFATLLPGLDEDEEAEPGACADTACCSHMHTRMAACSLICCEASLAGC